MAAEVPLPSISPRRPASLSPASCRPASVSHARSRAHQTPFCARGLQKIIAVSENAPGAHGIVPRHCSTRAAGMSTAPPRSPRPPPSLPQRESGKFSSLRETPSTKPPPRDLLRETSATNPPPRTLRREPSAANPHREAPAATAPAAPPLPRREEQQGQTGEQHREIHSLVLDVILLEKQRSEDESDHDAAAPYHRDDREQRPLILDRIEIECV